MSPAAPAKTKTENLYEGMFLLDSGKFVADPDGSAAEVLNILDKAGATLVAHRPWADGKLAYAIEGERKGLHYLTYFRMSGEGLTDVARSCKLSELVLRHLVIKHPQSLFDAMVEALNSHESGVMEERSALPVEVEEEEPVEIETEDEI